MSALGANRPRRPNSRFITTRSGKALRINRSLGQRWAALREGKSLRRANRLQNLPKSRLKRWIWRLSPGHLKEYWWSRDGAIMAVKVVGIGVLALFVLMLAVFAYFRKDLKNINGLNGNTGGSISYYDRTGKVLLFSDYDAVKRIPVASNQISQYMKDATVATEDRGFYSEPGFSVRGILRAAVDDLVHHGAQQGGSTITEQLVKLQENWSQNRTLGHKIGELILAVDLDRTYSKDDILTGYLNSAPYGGVDVGVQVAASDYFHTSAQKLTLSEAAMLAAIPKSPSYYSPYGPYYDKQALIDRYKYVLQSMADTHYITQAQADAASKVAVYDKVFKQTNKYAGIQDPYFVLAAKNQLYNQIIQPGENTSTQIGGWKVITTLDVNLQNKANAVVAANLPNVERYGGDEEAFAAEDVKTGQMVSLVGGVDFNAKGYGQINFAQWPISPGSSFKPYDYSTFINNNNAGAGSVLYDTVAPLPGYPCTNKALPPPYSNGNCLEDYDFRSPGPESLRYALGGSRNIPAVKAMLEADPNDHSDLRTDSVNTVINTADALMNAPDAYNCYSSAQQSQKTKTQCYGSSALGDGAFLHLDQHVNGLASLARMGVAIPQTYILNVQDANGKNLYQWKQPQGTQVLKPDAAYIVDSMASDPRASYLPGSCTTGANATCTPLSSGGYKFHRINGWVNAVKTGTTGDSLDGLMTSWNTQYAAAAWVGYHTRTRPLSTFMELLTEPVTRPWMEFALNSLHKSPVNWQQPSDIQTLPAYVLNHKISSNGEQIPSPATDIYPSWYKPRSGAVSSTGIDKVSGLLATSCTPSDAIINQSGSSGANAFSVDAFYGAGFTNSTSSSTAQDNVHKCGDSKPSIDTIDVTDFHNGTYQLSATAVAGTHPLTGGKYGGTISFAIDGTTVGTGKIGSDGSASITFTNTKYSGSHTVTATVTDSVLYQASGSRTASFTKGQSAGPSNLTATAIGGKTTITWSGGASPFSVSDNATGAINDCTASGCKVDLSEAPVGSTVTVKDANNKSTSVVVH